MKKVLALTILCCMLVTMLPAMAAADEKITLDWWVTDVATLVDIYEKVAEAYEAQHPNVDIRLSSYTDQYDEKLKSAQAADQAPDIYIEPVLANGVTSGMFLDLTPYMQRDGFDPESTYFQPYMDFMCKYQDKYYALPRDVFSLAIVYNKDLFDAAGIPYPKEGWTLEDLRQTAIKLTDPSKKQFGVVLPEIWSLFSMMWSFGGDMCNEDGTKAEGYINAQGTADFMKYVQDLIYADHASPSSAQMESYGGNEQEGGSGNIFMLGKLGMIAVERYAVGDFINAGMNIGAVSMPVGVDGKLWTYASAPSWSISATTKHPDEAWDFLKFAFGPEGSKILAETHFFFPCVKEVAQSMGFDKDPVDSVFFQQLDESRSTKLAFWWRRPVDWTGVWNPPILDGWDVAWDEIVNNQADVTETLNNAAAEIDQGIADYIRQNGK
jgi:multiple sugar transport system substrate-binding protein